MCRSAAALLARSSRPPPSPAPEGLEAVQAAVAAAMRAVDRKFAAAHAAVPSLVPVLAAPSMGSILPRRAFSSSAPVLPVPAATGHASTPSRARPAPTGAAAPSRRAVLSSAFSCSAPALALAAAEARLEPEAVGRRRASLPRSLSGGDLPHLPSDAGGGSNGGAVDSEAGERRLSPRGAGPLLSRSAQDRPQRTDSDCSSGRGGRRAQAGTKPAGPASAAWPRGGAAGRRTSLGAAACDPGRPGAERRFAPAASRVGGGAGNFLPAL